MTARRLVRAGAAGLVVVAVTAAALGWLDVMRRAGTLHGAGPKLREALALQRLAGGAAQPLGRIALAWLPAGVAGGALLALVGMRRRIPRGALLFCGCAALLLALDAAADAITASEPLSAHLAAQPGRLSIWAAAALVGLGGLVAGRAPR
jgi:hypothetical protein